MHSDIHQHPTQGHYIELRSLAVGYTHGRSKHAVASGLEATAPPSTLTCIIGRNGRGKSTLLRTLAALQPPLGGQALADGTDISRLAPESMARTVGIVLTARPEATDMTVAELVQLGRTPYTGFWGRLTTADRDIAVHAMRSVGIEPLATRRVCSLSDGECQKAMIAKTLAQQTPFILLDEPTAFLDFAGKIGLMRLLCQLAHHEGKTILMTTHDLEMALHTADRLWVMHDEGISEGPPRQLAASGDIDRYIDRPDVTLDPRTLSIMLGVKNEE